MLLSPKVDTRHASRLLTLAAILACPLHPALALYEVPDPTYAAPASYYNNALGTGTVLQTNLHTIISAGFVAYSYGDSRSILPTLWQDPANSNNMILYYTNNSIVKPDGSNGGIYGWDAGITWNREHIWPKYWLNLTSSQVTNTYKGIASDLFELAPADPNVNSTRSNYGYALGTDSGAYKLGSSGGINYWFPSDESKGDGARSLFYMATRYFDGSGTLSATNLQLLNGLTWFNDTQRYVMGDLASLLRWNYQDGVNNFERRKNDLIYDTYQKNRNPYIDHPEYVWAVFGSTNNDTTLSLATPATDGSSTGTLTLRAVKNGTFATANATLSKTGGTPTTFDVSTAGNATISVVNSATANAYAGTGQVFDIGNQTRTITASLNASTATTGLKTGSITIKNTDLTTAGAGKGAADANDTLTVNGYVLDKRTITPANSSFALGTVIVGASVSSAINLSTTGDDLSATRVTVSGAAATDSNGIAISGASTLFNSANTTATRTLGGAFSSPGAKSGSLSLSIATAENGGAGLPGEGAYSPLAFSYTGTALAHATPSLSASANASTLALNFGTIAPGGEQPSASLPFNLANLVTAAGFTAALNVDSSSLTGSPTFSSDLATSSNLAAGSQLAYNAAFAPPTNPGSYSATLVINSSDQSLPGALARGPLTLTLTALIDGPLVKNTATSVTFSPGFVTNYTASLNNGLITLTGPGNSFKSISGAGSLTVAAGASATADALASVALTVNGSLKIRPNGNSTSTPASLTIAGAPGAWTGQLDLADNALILPAATSKTTLASQITSARDLGNAGPWTGNGITSSALPNDPANLTTLALADNADLQLAAFKGQPLAPDSLILTRALLGDANLDNTVDLADYDLWFTHVGTPGLATSSGDFNLDTNIDLSDYDLWYSHVGAILPSASFPLAAAALPVPEPASLTLLSLAALRLLKRRPART